MLSYFEKESTLVIIVGLIASVFVVMLSFTIQRKNIVAVSSMLAIATIVQYAMLEKYSTMFLAATTLLYGLLTLFERRFPVIGSKYALPVLAMAYSAVFFVVNGFQVNMEIVAYLASLTGVLIMAVKNQLIAKWLMLFSGVAWVVYQVSAGAYGQLPGEVFYTIGVLVSMVILYRARHSGIDLNKVPEFSTILRSKFVKIRNKRFDK